MDSVYRFSVQMKQKKHCPSVKKQQKTKQQQQQQQKKRKHTLLKVISLLAKKQLQRPKTTQ